MLETSRVTAELAAARAFADKVGLRVQLESRLAYLNRYAAPRSTRCVLSPDPAPYSFAFEMQRETRRDEWSPWFSGTLIYHGPRDGFDAPAMGWTIHI
jgi:hypothetical protein